MKYWISCAKSPAAPSLAAKLNPYLKQANEMLQQVDTRL
jgi:hypothetical protein